MSIVLVFLEILAILAITLIWYLTLWLKLTPRADAPILVKFCSPSFKSHICSIYGPSMGQAQSAVVDLFLNTGWRHLPRFVTNGQSINELWPTFPKSHPWWRHFDLLWTRFLTDLAHFCPPRQFTKFGVDVISQNYNYHSFYCLSHYAN